MLEPVDLLAIYICVALFMLMVVVWASYRVDAGMEELDVEKPELWRRIASNLMMVGVVVFWPIAVIVLPIFANRLYEKISSNDKE